MFHDKISPSPLYDRLASGRHQHLSEKFRDFQLETRTRSGRTIKQQHSEKRRSGARSLSSLGTTEKDAGVQKEKHYMLMLFLHLLPHMKSMGMEFIHWEKVIISVCLWSLVFYLDYFVLLCFVLEYASVTFNTGLLRLHTTQPVKPSPHEGRLIYYYMRGDYQEKMHSSVACLHIEADPSFTK